MKVRVFSFFFSFSLISRLLVRLDALGKVGNGWMQVRILLICGLGFMADAMEIMVLSFMSASVGFEWCLEKWQESAIASAVFAGELLGCLFLGTLVC